MNAVLSTLTTPDDLTAAMEKSRKKKMTSSDLLEQKISFVFGMLDHESTMTRDEVRSKIRHLDGLE